MHGKMILFKRKRGRLGFSEGNCGKWSHVGYLKRKEIKSKVKEVWRKSERFFMERVEI